jgi:hypothetical protein
MRTDASSEKLGTFSLLLETALVFDVLHMGEEYTVWLSTGAASVTAEYCCSSNSVGLSDKMLVRLLCDSEFRTATACSGEPR